MKTKKYTKGSDRGYHSDYLVEEQFKATAVRTELEGRKFMYWKHKQEQWELKEKQKKQYFAILESIKKKLPTKS